MKKFIYIIILTVALSGVLSASAETASTEVSASGSTGTASTTLRAKLQAELELRQTNIKNTVEERKDAVGAVRTETKDKNTLLRQSNKTLIQTGVKENKGAILENRAQIKTNQEDVRSTIKNISTSTRAKLEAERERSQGVRAELRVEFQVKLEAQKEELAKHRLAQKQALEEKKAEMKQKMADRKAALSEQKQKRVQEFLDKTVKRFEAAVERLKELAVRIDSRIAKFDDQGVNTADAKTALAEARVQIELAQTKIDAAALVSVEVVGGETPQAAFERVKTAFNEAEAAIKHAHELLVKSVVALKAFEPKGDSITATTTASTTTSAE